VNLLQVKFSKEAKKYVSKLDSISKLRLRKAFEKLSAEPPQGDIKPMQGQDNIYRLRVGDLRALFTIDNELILVTKIAPRGEVYK